jgi:hypothetical protein
MLLDVFNLVADNDVTFHFQTPVHYTLTRIAPLFSIFDTYLLIRQHFNVIRNFLPVNKVFSVEYLRLNHLEV